MTNSQVSFDQPYEVALLFNYTPYDNKCYFGIDWIDKPQYVAVDADYFGSIISVSMLWDTASNTPSFYKDIESKKVKYMAMATVNPKTNAVVCRILKVKDHFNLYSTLNKSATISVRGIELNEYDKRVFNVIRSSYKRHFSTNYISGMLLDQSPKLPETTTSHDSITNSPYYTAADALVNAYSYYKKHVRGMESSMMYKQMPIIDRVILNDPAVIVLWSDGTKTIAMRTNDDTFDPEVGLAMAISRKYYEILGFQYPRGAFKAQIRNADDRSNSVRKKRARKQKLLPPIEDTNAE